MNEKPEPDPIQFAESLSLFYNAPKHSYQLANGDDLYEERSIAELRRDLAMLYQVRRKKYQDRVINWIEHHRIVRYAGPLAGFKAGVYSFNGNPILVTASPTVLAPRKGAWQQIERILEGMFGAVQLPYVYGWLKIARSALATHTLRPGQTLILAGPQNCGKSFIQQHIITTLLGGRVGFPYAFISNKTAFNSELIGCEHWALDDETPPDDFRTRRLIESHLKQISSNATIWGHQKCREAIALPILRRLSVSVNDDAHSLKVLPPLGAALEGKVILCQIRTHDFPWPTSDVQWQAFTASISPEIPAFAYFLDSYEIPDKLRDQRYGVKGYQDAALAEKVNRLGPEFELLDLIRVAISKTMTATFPFEGTALEIFELIYNQEYLRDALRRLSNSRISTGRLLTSLVEQRTPGIYSRLLDGRRIYTIENEPEK